MIAGIAVEALTLTLRDFRLQKLEFAVAAGEILVMLGPNGAGKSVTLETIAGFHRPDSGRVLIDGRDVTALPPERRRIGFVVQNFGLFPHLTVGQNVAIAARAEPARAATGDDFPPVGDPAALLTYFGVAHLAERSPLDLSPGEKQRVALARALAAAPDLFLFDEPFAALDAQTRDHLRDELLSFLRKLAIPAIFVTHDHVDAVTLADRIAVLHEGAMVQSGLAGEILQKPANSFVARFVGFKNIVRGRLTDVKGGVAIIDAGKQTLYARAPLQPIAAGSPVFLGIHADDVRLRCPAGAAVPDRTSNRLQGRITGLRHTRPLVVVSVDCGFPLEACLFERHVREMKLGLGNTVVIEIAASAIHLMTE